MPTSDFSRRRHIHHASDQLKDDVHTPAIAKENCKFDYSTFTRVRTAGPVILSHCSLRETTFDAADLTEAAFDDCDLRLSEFDGGRRRGLDLRGNDLSQLRGLASLKHVIIDRSQTLQLAEALAAELGVTYGEDLESTSPPSQPSGSAGHRTRRD